MISFKPQDDADRDWERRLAELEVRARHERFAFQIARVGAFEWQIEEDKIRFSRDYERLLGREPVDSEGSYGTLLGDIHFSHRERADGQIRQALKCNQKTFEGLYRVAHPERRTVVLLLRTNIVRVHSAPVYMYGVCIDVTNVPNLVMGAKST